MSFRSSKSWNESLSWKKYRDYGDYIDDWIVSLWKQISDEQQKNQLRFDNTDDLSKLICAVCDRLKQPRDVWYQTLEIYERFMSELYITLNAHVQSSSCKKEEWRNIICKSQEQTLLRIVSCVQIASKMNCTSRCVTKADALSIVNKGPKQFQMASIGKSEIRVLETLKFKLKAPSLLDFYDITFGAVAMQMENLGGVTSNDLKEIYNMGVEYLDSVQFQKSKIYRDFFSELVGEGVEPSQEAKESFEVVIRDHFLMASGVIHASAMTVKPRLADSIEKSLWQTVGIEPNDFAVLSGCIIKTVLE
ncbi:uncharacterized protein LOC136029866 [Artemia franciscana]